MARAIINVPPNPKRGEIIEIRALIQHPMQTGYRPDSSGVVIARDLVRRFTCHFQSTEPNTQRELVLDAELFAAVAANPYLAFHMVALSRGTLVFNWSGDNGFVQTESVALNVV